ncbi:MAG: hypothetical protein ACE5H3_01270 [Planctomycetota bacterium]
MLLVGGGWALFGGSPAGSSGGGAASSKAPLAAAEPPPGEDAAPAASGPGLEAAQKRARYFRDALAAHNLASLRGQMALPVWFERDNEETGKRFSYLRRDEQESYGEELARRLAADPSFQALAALESPSEEWHGESGRKVLQLSGGTPPRRWAFSLVPRGTTWLVTGLEELPPEPSPEEPGAGDGGETPPPKSSPASRLMVAVEGGGEIFRGTIQKVGPLPETSAQEWTLLRGWVDEVLKESGLASHNALRSLVEAGQPSIPALLDRLAGIPIDRNPDHLDRIALIDRTLQMVSGRNSLWPLPGITSITDPGELQERRRLSVESWFGWWSFWGGKWDRWLEKSGRAQPDDRRRPPPR